MKTLFSLGVVAMLLWGQANACLTEEQEPNDSESQANGPLCSGVTVLGSMRNRNDVDWFYFDTIEKDDIHISLGHGNNVDFDWYLYQETGSYVLSGQTSDNPETGTYVAGDPGRYYLMVDSYRGRGNYELTVWFAEGGTEPEPDPEPDPGPEPDDCDYGPRPNKPGPLRVWRVGSSEDTCVQLDEPALLLMGGGTDVDEAFENRIMPHIQGGNIVVLRTSGSDGYNDYLYDLTGASSVETMLVDTRDKANSDYVDWVIRTAEFLWIAGGDQSDYLNQWEGTRVQDAIQYVFDKGGVVGGTSAGNHVLSQFIYDPDGVLGAISDEVVTDFCHETINISTNFLSFPWLVNTLNDSHFYERNRMGRSAVFQAHLGADSRIIGISEQTSLFIPASGEAIVDGRWEVYILRADSQTEYVQTTCGEPVAIDNLRRYRLLRGDTYNLINDTTNVNYIRLNIDGTRTDYYDPSDPY